ncbi:polyprenyl synthetase family protein [Mobilicoccus pelagius]|uniref:Putative polyprenyl diphosphate synthase n=1 Tax=Mobilicoccus pelagius NBRC 104925 TaxID=1089455 RepID=H5UQB8_9MICO|nr:polyprenyl synthetase family protein [Mobilicoccus pelagius]GAB47926.1 putative polyprenyl diphosphate synthase [Mobilicoccus pelagius NBRC 104925]
MSAGSIPTPLPGLDPATAESLLEGLGRVESYLRDRVRHEDPFIAEASGHLLAAGGKRVRPMLTLLASQLGSGMNDDVVAAAAAVELTHLASLYHDDVMDEAELRRGAPSANSVYDNSTAILVGDLLFGNASSVVADLGAEAVKIQAETFMRLCSGQIRDDRPCPPTEDAVEYYIGVLRDKTGSLIATAARFGAMFGGCDDRTVSLLREYGELLGIAFQLADDLLDIESRPGVSGKTPGTDLREGVDTLPVLFVRRAPRAEDARLLELLDSDLAQDDAGVAEALELLKAHPALEEARVYTRGIAARAQEQLSPLGDGPVTAALWTLASSVVDRAV